MAVWPGSSGNKGRIGWRTSARVLSPMQYLVRGMRPGDSQVAEEHTVWRGVVDISTGKVAKCALLLCRTKVAGACCA